MIRLPSAITCAAAFAMTASPAAALDMPAPPSPLKVETGGDLEAANWGHRRRRHRGGIDAGDVIAGVLVIGAIAAIAGSANSRNRERERRVETYPRRDNVRYEQRGTTRSASGIDNAVDMCIDQVERGDDRVESVDNASRTGDGWRVSGALDGGEGWNCWIDNDGRIREVDFGTRYSASGEGASYTSASADQQLSDEAYANARAATNRVTPAEEIDADLVQGAQPAYPGGPLEGENFDEADTRPEFAAR